MDLMCRTCLRMAGVQFNIFQYFQNNKLISDLLMECTPIKVEAGDGLPINICNNCVDRLKSAFEFKTMVVQSDMNLKKYPKGVETDNRSQNNFKIETSDIKNEKKELLHDSADFDNIRDDNKEVHNCKSGVDYSHTQKNCPLDSQNVLIKQENLPDVPVCNNSEQEKEFFENEASYRLHACSIENNHSVNYLNSSTVIENIEREHNQLSEKESLDKFEMAHENSLLKPKDESLEDSFQDDAVTEIKQQMGSSETEDVQEVNTVTESILKPRAYNLLNRNRCVNERQAEVLDNPDFKRILEMKLSTREKSRQRVYCEMCDKTFCFQYFVTIHAQYHTGNYRFKCDKCDASFVKKPLLDEHLCPYREREFQSSVSDRQSRSQHTNKTKKFSCEYCGKVFASNNLLRAHISCHIGKVHKCNLCEKAYQSSFLLKRHMKMHNNERDFMCDECGKTFLQKRCLAKHKMTHIPVPKDQSFECNICNKKFTRRRSLVEHIKVHTTQAPYVCNQCGKSFRYSKILKHHLFIHTGEKPYPCTLCDRTFRQKSAIGRHMRTHTGETPYSCEICSCTFKYKPRLLEHMKKHERKNDKIRNESE